MQILYQRILKSRPYIRNIYQWIPKHILYADTISKNS
jgi:hypothetical protein